MIRNSELNDIAEKIERGVRLDFEDGIRLFHSNDLALIGHLANTVRMRLHGKKVFYSVNLHLNHTNVCTGRCFICAFSRRPGPPSESGSYTLTQKQIKDIVSKAIDQHRINEIHMTGGANPELGIAYFVEIFQAIHSLSPDLFIKALTAVEIDALAKRCGLSWEEILKQLKVAGLGALAGGGAEIFNETTREKICPGKISASDWLEVHRTAHRLGLMSNATMLYGHVESVEDRVDHLLRIRALQDETHGFQSFVPLAFNPAHTRFEDVEKVDGYTVLKTCAISRLLLDNVPHIKMHWPSLDLKIASVGLSFGVDDFGGTNIHEKIMHEAGNETPIDLSEQAMRRYIERDGFEPVLTNSSFSKLKVGVL